MEKGYRHIIYLINPPGWILNPGGAYIALPLLKSSLHRQGIESRIIDANIDAASYNDLKIDQRDVDNIGVDFSLATLNKPYFREQNKMKKIASVFDACWDIQLGYNPNGYDFSSSESVKEFSKNKSVYTEYFRNKLIPFIQLNNPTVIGLSVTVPQQLLPTFEFCRLLKNEGYQGKIILGGNMITRIGENINLPWVFDIIDALVLFQGEISISDYFKCLKNNLSFENVPNLVWECEGKIITNRIEYLKPKEFSRPDFSDLNVGNYWGNNYLTLLGSRGCYYGKCSFCAIPYAYGNSGFLGHDKSKNVFNDIVTNIEYFGIRNYKFTDESLHPIVLKDLSEELIKQKIDCNFEGYARFDNFWKNENFLKLVSKAGLRKVYLGLELIQTGRRGLLNKSDSNDALEMLLKFNDAGIKVHLFTLFGYPGTGIDDAINTIQFTLKYQKLIDTLDIFPFYYAKHTKIPFVNPIIKRDKDWAIEYDYETTFDGALNKDEVSILCEKLEDVIWNERPEWLHPIYRMISPFGKNVKGNQSQQLIVN